MDRLDRAKTHKIEGNDKIFRVFVEKKPGFAIEAKKLKNNLQVVFGIKTINSVRIFNRYDVVGIASETFNKAINGIFCEPQVDYCYEDLPKLNGRVFAVEFLPGQYDSRADFCQQCLQLLLINHNKEFEFVDRQNGDFCDFDCFSEIKVKTAKVFCFEGGLNDEEFLKIKHYLINPVECREASVEGGFNFKNEVEIKNEIEILQNFNSLDDVELSKFLQYKALAMDFSDLKFCQDYFKNIEKRPPTMAEIKVIDTYWSDHCRHTTFFTNLEKISIADERVKEVYDFYLNLRKSLNRKGLPNLMDLATIAAKKLKLDGKLKNVDESEEVNACSVNVVVETVKQNKTLNENWLLVFKNETHNHPTEIEPFGGAATCIGGAIRDPLSARAYVFQAMRVSGAADPLQPVEKTLKGKLPQCKIVKTAAEGYSSYGNQVGVATGFVQEIYHPGYLAKRLEIGAVVGAVLKKNVVKKKPQAGDVVVLLGGKTGRDGCEGAVGSSKLHTKNSINSCGAQVQKGNPVEERKLQRFFRNCEVSKLIKRCNDFGAGGVCVAIGELADGLEVNLNAVPKKYEGLNDVELAISESQERMAVVVSRSDLDLFLQKAEAENLMATKVAEVTQQKRLVLNFFDKKVVDLSREFLNSNGTPKYATIETGRQSFSLQFDFENSEKGWCEFFSKLNVCSQKGLVEMFDSTIGAGCVLMPYGGKFQATKAQSMAFLFPTSGVCKTVSTMAFGFDPFLMEQSPFFGAQYAVIESVAKLVACGVSVSNCWLTFQEYFPSLKKDAKLWGQPFLALLGAFNAQMGLGVASIGGKDSMSGTFENLQVPPTLVSFAVGLNSIDGVVSMEFKKVGSSVALVLPEFGVDFEPNYESLLTVFSLVEELISKRKVLSACALGFGGIARAVCEMGFGNRIGFEFESGFDEKKLGVSWFGGFLVELNEDFEGSWLVENCENLKIEIIGHTISSYIIKQNGFKVCLNRIEKISAQKLEPIYATKLVNRSNNVLENFVDTISVCEVSDIFKKAKSKVLLILPVVKNESCEFNFVNYLKIRRLIEELKFKGIILSERVLQHEFLKNDGFDAVEQTLKKMSFENEVSFAFESGFYEKNKNKINQAVKNLSFDGYVLELSETFDCSEFDKFKDCLEVFFVGATKTAGPSRVLVEGGGEGVLHSFTKAGNYVAIVLPKVCENSVDLNNLKLRELIEKLKMLGMILSGIVFPDSKEELQHFELIVSAINKMSFENEVGFEFEESSLGLNGLKTFSLMDLKTMVNSNWNGGALVELSETFDCSEFDEFESFFKIFVIGKTVSKPKKEAPTIKKHEVRVLVPVFPGTNCEFDLIRKFEQAGAVCEQFVLNNLNFKNIFDSANFEFEKILSRCQIVALAGGFSAGDEPDGSAKFIASFFRNDFVKEAIEKFLDGDGLMIGICNGFQALVKLGLIEFGKIVPAEDIHSTLTYNEIGHHQSKLVKTRVCCNRSPWLWNTKVGDVFSVPVSNGEGRFVVDEPTLIRLVRNNQIVTQYVDFDGQASMEIEHNPSGSFMAIEGLISPNGRILGKMGHNERVSEGLFRNIEKVEEQKIFQAGVDYFKG